MNFRELSLKMAKVNIRRYAIYFLCSGFITMLVFLYLTMYTNKDFNDSSKVNSMISSNLFAPTLALGIFSVVFIVHFHNYFIKSRKKDFSLFMTLGLTNNDIRKIIVLENILITAGSILVGLAMGTLFSKIFYCIVLKITDLNIDFSMNLKSYLYTIVFLGSINLIMILKSCVFVPVYQIIELLKAEHRADYNFMDKKIFRILGISLIISSIIIQWVGIINKKSFIPIYVNMVISLIGIYLFVANLHFFIDKFLKLFKQKTANNLVWVSNLKYSIGSSKNIIFLSTLFLTTIVYFMSFSSTGTEILQKNIFISNPYDLAYGEVYNKNKLSEDKLKSILQDNNVKIDSIDNLEFITQGAMTIISDERLKESLGIDLTVEKGQYTYLHQINKNDGYLHNNQEVKSYKINEITYTCQDKIDKILFNNIPILKNTNYLIFSDEDYLKIKSTSPLKNIGNIKFINFNDWSKTEKVVQALIKELQDYNKKNTKQFFQNEKDDIKVFKPVSKIEDLTLLKESSRFLMFILCFVFSLFFMASNLMIHFKLLLEEQREKVKYQKLYKIGFTERDLSSNISKELMVLFLVPCFLGIYLGGYYICFKLSSIGFNNSYGIKYSMFTGCIYILLELLFYLAYRRYYIKKILS
ncbi:FtsX-like permease family protein [Clostridium cellulovorans]|uniref:ABC3 transporter permease C-terminal domain-containing protein n=1 Tax=Clostridium cellulovorans (strain ATCC 35296 / DSM 3052 / OCM 3 / 743B) TaxID=573061 RepID=D9SPN2_CLOC7|nr:ABC transporter permease [Clostridium cellulovorans]ADL50081.1 protein of unknown function DUF214 [Clostridium cellulovorans 743B]